MLGWKPVGLKVISFYALHACTVTNTMNCTQGIALADQGWHHECVICAFGLMLCCGHFTSLDKGPHIFILHRTPQIMWLTSLREMFVKINSSRSQTLVLPCVLPLTMLIYPSPHLKILSSISRACNPALAKGFCGEPLLFLPTKYLTPNFLLELFLLTLCPVLGSGTDPTSLSASAPGWPVVQVWPSTMAYPR